MPRVSRQRCHGQHGKYSGKFTYRHDIYRFFENTIGLHVNGKAKIVENDELLADKTQASVANSIQEEGVAPERWIFITVEEAYIHCSKHIPHLKKLDKKIHWGTDKEPTKAEIFLKPNPAIDIYLH